MSSLRGILGPLLAVLLAWCLHSCLSPGPRGAPRWWKGNTHTHTLWSDGDGAPELVADWYRDAGYDFLVLSDHNVLSRGETWFPVQPEGRLTPERVQELVERFGQRSVRLRTGEGGPEMRLATLSELRARFQRPGEFLLIQGEEITDAFEGAPVHVNALNLLEPIAPPGGASLQETLQNALDAVTAQSEASGRPMLAHVNHPNYGFALGWHELADLRGERFFEVYNGHPAVNNDGDLEHAGLELAWDLALTRRLTETDLGLLYGLATDDAHSYHEQSASLANAGRGWVQVLAPSLEPDEIVRAMQRGDFYSSTGVELESFSFADDTYVVDIRREPGDRTSTVFIGATRDEGGNVVAPGILHETRSDPAVYAMRGNEVYVRAWVSRAEAPLGEDQVGRLPSAWLQPVLGPAAW